MQLASGVMVVCAVALGAPAWAASAGAGSVTEGKLSTRDGKETVDVPLKHTEVRIRVAGHLADTEVVQTFGNPYPRKIEAVYLFPLPTGAAVNEMEMISSGKTFKGAIKPKDEAKRIYVEAKREGNVAALLTQERPNLFTQSVANIEPGAEIIVKLRYVQSLDYDNGGYEIVFPMVAPPRYMPKTTTADAKAVQPAVLPPERRSSHDIGLAVELDAGVPVADIASPSHQVKIEHSGKSAALIRIDSGDTIPNKDFILRYRVAGKRPEFALIPYRESGDGSFFLMAQPPADAAPALVTPRELVFVLDTSSSMTGLPMAKAKQLVRRTLEGMAAEDTFQIIRFDDNASAFGRRPIANKPQNVKWALEWLGALGPGGGTEMLSGLEAALAVPHDPARLRIVVFLTDGYIGNEDEVLAAVAKHMGEARLFSFGVGSAVNRYLLEEMARIGRGAMQVVRPDEDTTASVERFYQRIARPILTDLRIDWNGLEVADVVPGAIPDLFVGQPLVLSGHYRGPGAATITVYGKQAGADVAFKVPVTLPAREASRPAVATVWARARIAEIGRQQLRGDKPEYKDEITRLALSHHLMSAYTAFVVVDTTHATKGGPAETVQVPVEVPEGVRQKAAANASGEGGGFAVSGMLGLGKGGGGSTLGSAFGSDPLSGVGGGGDGLSGAHHSTKTVVAADEAVAIPETPKAAPAAEPNRVARESAPVASPPSFANSRIVAQTATVSGSLDREDLLRQVKRDDIKAIYQRTLKSDPNFAGKLILEITIAGNGTVAAVKISESTLPKNDEFVAAVLAAARKWTFNSSGGPRVIIKVPFEFAK